MGKIDDLERIIEIKRNELNVIGDKYPLTSEAVIKISQELDELLNEFQKVKRAAL